MFNKDFKNDVMQFLLVAYKNKIILPRDMRNYIILMIFDYYNKNWIFLKKVENHTNCYAC